MRWYWRTLGGHVHVRVFTTGSKCGDLVFTVQEWPAVKDSLPSVRFHCDDEALRAGTIS